MSAKVLKLNKNWMPIDVIDAIDALQKVFNRRALCIDIETFGVFDFDGWIDNWDSAIRMSKVAESQVVRSNGLSVRLPDVIVCTEYRGFGFKVDMRHRPSFSRRNLYLRDRNTCQFCGKKLPTEELTMDHVVPKSKGGLVCWTNIVLACVSCNSKKSNKSLQGAGMKLIRPPFEPKPEDLKLSPFERLKIKMGRNVPTTWEHFLGKAYWTATLE